MSERERVAQIQVTFQFEVPFTLGVEDWPEDMDATEAARRIYSFDEIPGGIDTALIPDDCTGEIDARWLYDDQEVPADA